ncbi:hypothetical protein K458DRAFT_388366 [Lentithecium fluviatile CBS 122367]|uniref:Methyltransferase n=1 Tax=Lentithecium fluviatile CBS 122367 TaxID=1168545 RepID=A0A6G1J357_9PLEO|nr:hypothetical protein K458DRAFT_388366 [Lentithecium fluviatile CBS 122367]
MSKSQDCFAVFNYLEWDPLYETEKPFQIFSDIPAGSADQRKDNLNFKPGPSEKVHDVRGDENHFTLDKNGFEYIRHKTKVLDGDIYSKEHVQDIYLPECAQVLKTVLDGADEVHVFDWRRRCEDTSSQFGMLVDYSDRNVILGPARSVHVDSSDTSIMDRIYHLWPDRADYLLQGRIRWINLWRPLKLPVRSAPLAVCDGTTLDESNLVEVHRIRRQFIGCTWFSMYQENIKWYYMSSQSPEDLLLFKTFDSMEGKAKYSAHSAFDLDTGATGQPRESIEARALVFTYPENLKPMERD